MAFGSLPSVLGSGGGTAYSLIGGTGLFADGTAAAPSISFASDSDTGIYRYATNSIGFATGGANRFFMSGSQFGGVTGQNIDMPAAGSIALTASGTNQNITLTPSGTGRVVFNPLYYAQIDASSGTDSVLQHLKSGVHKWESGVNSGDAYYIRNSTSGTPQFNILGNGRVLLGTTTDSGALLQLGGAGTTTAATNGIVFCTDTTIHRSSAGLLRFGGTQTTAALNMGTAGYVSLGNVSGGSCEVRLLSAGSIDLVSNGTTALTLDSSQRTILAGALRLNNAYVAGAVVGTGYVTIQDSTGTTYRIPVLV